MIAINGILITERMHEAGIRAFSDAYNATIRKSMGGMGECKQFDPNDFREHANLIKKYMEDEIDSVKLIYFAMEEAKED